MPMTLHAGRSGKQASAQARAERLSGNATLGITFFPNLTMNRMLVSPETKKPTRGGLNVGQE